MKFSNIKQFPFAAYSIDVSWNYIQEWINSHQTGGYDIDLEPEYQRGYVWTIKQKIAYIEYQLRGGFSGRDIYFNCPGWMSLTKQVGPLEIVDGKQRLNAVLEFLDNKIPAFGHYKIEYEDKLGIMNPTFKIHVNNLKTKKEIVEWYIGFNTGGSIHTEQDLKPAYELLEKLK